jgi:MSHA biogenesis protein MshN
MSVINQLLLDLEKRRASGAERSMLPDHVRALPNEERPVQWGWIVAGGAAAAVALAATWLLTSGFSWTGARPAVAQPVGPAAEATIERVVAASAGIVTDARVDDALRDAPASRLSFELSNPPVAAEPVASPLPTVATSRVVGSGAAGTAVASTQPAASAARTESTRPAPTAAKAQAAGAVSDIKKEVHQPTPRELAEGEFRKASALLQQSRFAEAQEGFQAALAAYPAHHGARQGLVGLLLESRRYPEAERVLSEGIALAPSQLGFVMTLARLQLDRGEGAQAVATLKKGLEHGQGSADYVAFLAALQQRQGRHDEAIEQFAAALRMRPANGVWWLGLGISLQAVNRAAEAQEAYSRARSTNSLSPELAAFAEQRLKQLQ